MSKQACIVQCQRLELLTMLQIADGIVPSSSPKPILTRLHLVADESALKIVATDSQVGLTCTLQTVQVRQAGDVIVSPKQLVPILKESESSTVLLTEELHEGSAQLRIDLADGEYRIPAVLGEEFPAVSTFAEAVDGEIIDISAADLKRMISQTLFAVDREKTSAVLSGVSCRIADGQCFLAGTDGKVLGEARHSDDGFSGRDISAVLPSATVAHLQKILGLADNQHLALKLAHKLLFVRVAVGTHDAMVIELTGRLVDGSYPAYGNALQVQPEAVVEFKTADLASAVRRTMLMTNSNARAIVVELSSGQAILRNLSSAAGSAQIPVACVYDGNARKIGFNAEYLGNVLRVYEGDTIAIELSAPGRGAIIRQDNATFLVMPVALPS